VHTAGDAAIKPLVSQHHLSRLHWNLTSRESSPLPPEEIELPLHAAAGSRLSATTVYALRSGIGTDRRARASLARSGMAPAKIPTFSCPVIGTDCRNLGNES
jgi:hypothetical protein